MEKLPTYGHSADEYQQLIDDLSVELSRQAKLLTLMDPAERDFDREGLRGIILEADLDPTPEDDASDFAWCVEWDAPLDEFLPQLQHLHQDILGDYVILAMNYPDGFLDTDSSEYVSAMPNDDWDPED